MDQDDTDSTLLGPFNEAQTPPNSETLIQDDEADPATVERLSQLPSQHKAGKKITKDELIQTRLTNKKYAVYFPAPAAAETRRPYTRLPTVLGCPDGSYTAIEDQIFWIHTGETHVMLSQELVNAVPFSAHTMPTVYLAGQCIGYEITPADLGPSSNILGLKFFNYARATFHLDFANNPSLAMATSQEPTVLEKASSLVSGISREDMLKSMATSR